MGLRLWLLPIGTDDRGLLRLSDPLFPILLLLTLLVLPLLYLAARTEDAAPKSRTLLYLLASLAAGVGILCTEVETIRLLPGGFSWIAGAVGLAAVPCLPWQALAQSRGKRPPLAALLIPCLYFLIHLLAQYRLWGMVPQLYRYLFPMLASLSLLLAAYHRAAADILPARRGALLFHTQAAAFFSFLAVPNGSALFFVTQGLWMAASLLTPVSPERREEA